MLTWVSKHYKSACTTHCLWKQHTFYSVDAQLISSQWHSVLCIYRKAYLVCNCISVWLTINILHSQEAFPPQPDLLVSQAQTLQKVHPGYCKDKAEWNATTLEISRKSTLHAKNWVKRGQHLWNIHWSWLSKLSTSWEKENLYGGIRWIIHSMKTP